MVHEVRKSTPRESPLFAVLETLLVAGVFVLVARLWPINQHLDFSYLGWFGGLHRLEGTGQASAQPCRLCAAWADGRCFRDYGKLLALGT